MNQSNWNKKVINRREQVRYENSAFYKSKGYLNEDSDSKKSHHKKRKASHNFFSYLVSMMKKGKGNSSYIQIKKEAKKDICLGIVGTLLSILLLLLVKEEPVSAGTMITFGYILVSAIASVILLTDGISSLLAIRKGKLQGIVKERFYIYFFLSILLFAYILFLGYTFL